MGGLERVCTLSRCGETGADASPRDWLLLSTLRRAACPDTSRFASPTSVPCSSITMWLLYGLWLVRWLHTKVDARRLGLSSVTRPRPAQLC